MHNILTALSGHVGGVRRGELAAVSLRVTPEALLRGARTGRVPMPMRRTRRFIPWYSYSTRAVLRPDEVHMSKSLRPRLRGSGWTTTLNAAFDEVVAHCADRPYTWLTPQMRAAFGELHRAGHAYSLEVWTNDTELVGGSFGVQVGTLLTGDSMFHRRPDASKIAMIDLADRLAAAGGTYIDCQKPSKHLASMGTTMIGRDAYLQLLAEARGATMQLPEMRLPVARLLA